MEIIALKRMRECDDQLIALEGKKRLRELFEKI